VQGLVILFTGALDMMVRMMLVPFFRKRSEARA
jgi:simple sugar transport system permease protein